MHYKMESKDELKETDIKNGTCYYFNDITKVWDINIYSSDILLDEKLYKDKYENVLTYDISYKTSTGENYCILGGYIKIEIHNKIRNLVLFDYSYCDEICKNIQYLISEKSGITDSINHNFARIRIDLYDSLPIEKILAFHNVIILITLVGNKNKNNYYYNIF